MQYWHSTAAQWLERESELVILAARNTIKMIQNVMSKSKQTLLLSAQDPSAMPRPTSQDLAGFWDLLQLSVDDVTAKFDELHQIKNNQWQLVESPEKKVPKHLCCDGNY